MSTIAAGRYAKVSHLGPILRRPTPAGWIGSKAGLSADFVTIDASGYLDQACAAGAAVGANTKVGMLCTPIASTVAADSDDAKKVQYESPTEAAEIELQVVNESDTVLATNKNMLQDEFGLYRDSSGNYHASSGGANKKLVCVGVGRQFALTDTGGTMRFKVIDAQRLG